MTFGKRPARSALGCFAYACEPAIVVRGPAPKDSQHFLLREEKDALLRRASRF